MRTQRSPSDLTDEQWALVEPLIPVYPGGRPRKTSMRAVLDAIFYVVRTGCPWRFLPKDFPPRSTVWGYFDEWRHNGTLEALHDQPRDRVRKQEKPGQPRRTASIDSQSVDSSSDGQARGRDNAKNVAGRKRHRVVDSLGLLLAVVVTAADVDDAAAAPRALAQLAGERLGHVRLVYAGSKYHNHALYGWVAESGWYDLGIVRRPVYPEGFKELAQKLGRPLHPPGRDVGCIVSAGLLTEGWDCNTVTHIVGLRPFMSQLLCEQVVGRGLRRAMQVLDANGRFTEEVAKVFGVPFTIIPFKAQKQGEPPPAVKRFHVHAIPAKAGYEIRYPRVDGYTQAIRNRVTVDWSTVAALTVDRCTFPPKWK